MTSSGPISLINALVTLQLSDADFQKLIDGKGNAQQMFMSGKLKVKGDVMKATKLVRTQRPISSLLFLGRQGHFSLLRTFPTIMFDGWQSYDSEQNQHIWSQYLQHPSLE